MKTVVLSPAAKADVQNIWDYTETRWGTAQAELYVGEIRDVCDALATNWTKGSAVDEVRTGYRKIVVGRHLLFYRIDENDAVDVVRILHQSMDIASHLEA